MIVATAGHVDHGKTSLVRALTGMDTDRLPQEKARGISIDLGFAHWDHEGGPTIGFVDVPGHERFIRNMVCGVCAIDHALLVVAADDGVMPQTREHVSIMDLLGVAQATVAVTKCDRASPARVTEVMQEVAQLLAGTGMAGAPMLAVSATRGDGIDALRQRLLQAAAQWQGPQALLAQHPRYVVDRVFSLAGTGTVVTGTVIAGRIAVNDALTVSPQGRAVRVRGMQRHGKAVQQAMHGQRCAINLAAIETSALGRGDWLVAPSAHAPTDRIDVLLHVLPAEQNALAHWTPVHVHIGAADVPARVAMRRGVSIAPGQSALAQLRLDRPVSTVHGERLILRDQSGWRTLGGGKVVDPLAGLRRSAAERALTLEALTQGEPGAALAQLLAHSPRGLDPHWFAQVFNLTDASVEALLPAGTVVISAPHRLAFSAEALQGLSARIGAVLERARAQSPQAKGVDQNLLKREVAPALKEAAFAALLKRFAADGHLVAQGGLVHLPGQLVQRSARDLRVWDQLRPLLTQAAFDIPSARELAVAADLALPVVRDVLHRVSASGELIKVTPERFALRETMVALAAHAHATAQAVPEGLFTAAQYRDRIGTGRGLAIEILECLDKHGLTRRIGNARRYVGGLPAVFAA